MAKRRYWFFSILLSIAVLFIYLQVLSFQFLKYDDTVHILDNTRLVKPSWGNALFFWTHDFFSLYVPVTYSVWTALAFLSQKFFLGRIDPGLFHAVNLLVHLLNTLLVFCFVDKISGLKSTENEKERRIAAAFVGALFFAAHPVQVEPVAWVSGLRVLLSVFFSFSAALVLLAVFAEQKRRKANMYRAVAGVLFIFALLSKPTAVSLPLTLFVILSWTGKLSHKRIFFELFPWGVLAGIIVIATKKAQIVPAQIESVSLLARPLIALDAISFYAEKIIWPKEFAVDYGRTPAFVLANVSMFSCVLWVLALFLWGFCLKKENRWPLLVLAWAVSILPVSGLVAFSYQEISTVADRYSYMAMLPVALLIDQIVERFDFRIVIPFFLGVILVLGGKSSQYCSVWKNTKSVMQHTLLINKASYVANLNLGVALISEGNFRESLQYLQSANELKPDKVLPYYNLALASAALGDSKKYLSLLEIVKGMDFDLMQQLERAGNLLLKNAKDYNQ